MEENDYAVRDVWLALKTVGTFIVYLAIASIVFNIFILSELMGIKDESGLYIAITFIILFVGFSKFILNMWNSYYKGIEVNLETKNFSFPASDVENSIIDILTLKPFFNMGKRGTHSLTEVEALNNETKRWSTKSSDGKTTQHTKYLLNISGEFGSKQLEFSAKQKRDECRAMLNRAVKKVGSKMGSSDMNLDFQ